MLETTSHIKLFAMMHESGVRSAELLVVNENFPFILIVMIKRGFMFDMNFLDSFYELLSEIIY
jgi:hypothetical protein